MRISLFLLAIFGVSSAAYAQEAARGLPPRATPAEYQAHVQAGAVTIAAEFTGHGVPTREQVLSNEEFVGVEVGFFGAADAHLQLSYQDFALRVNGKKVTLPAQQFGAVFKAIKDPEWVPPGGLPDKQSKGGLSTGGGGQSDGPPPVVHVPIELERAMQQHVQKASLPEGDRKLPEAGLIFFEYHGKLNSIHSMELLYNGPAGKATLTLQ